MRATDNSCNKSSECAALSDGVCSKFWVNLLCCSTPAIHSRVGSSDFTIDLHLQMNWVGLQRTYQTTQFGFIFRSGRPFHRNRFWTPLYTPDKFPFTSSDRRECSKANRDSENHDCCCESPAHYRCDSQNDNSEDC